MRGRGRQKPVSPVVVDEVVVVHEIEKYTQ